MAAVVVVFDGGGSICWCMMVSAMDYGNVMVRQRWLAQQEDERGAQEEATQKPSGMMRGQ